jgi:S-adenosylmethionine:tRNA ribosyltransferase-isomerase
MGPGGVTRHNRLHPITLKYSRGVALNVKLSDFDYDLPKGLIAQEPLASRDASRMLVLDGPKIIHMSFGDLPEYLRQGDVLVLNNTLVFPARLAGKRDTGGKVELLVLKNDGERAEALVRAKPLRPGETISITGGKCEVVKRIEGARYQLEFSVPGGIAEHLDRHGTMPTPPYVKKKLESPERYQTVFARNRGSVAAPTAGLHFTPELLDQVRAKGVSVAFVTLHIGPGTFQPVKALNIDGHKMEPEYYQVTEETAKAVSGRKGRLVAVGTTVVKTLESAARQGAGTGNEDGNGMGSKVGGRLVASEGWSDLFIHPGHEFMLRPDVLLTNFHLPRSTLVMLVSAYAGRERILAAYAEAVREKYRFYSFGDSMLCLS